MLRGMVLRRLGLCGDVEVVERFQKMFQTHLDGGDAVPADLRNAVYG